MDADRLHRSTEDGTAAGHANGATPLGDRRLFFRRSLVLAVGVRLGLLLGAYLVGRTLLELTGPLGSILAETVNRWDSLAYFRVARHGYTSVGESAHDIVRYPLYPAFISLFQFVLRGWLASGLAVSFAAAVAAGCFLQALVRLDAGEGEPAREEARRALWYMTFFPTAYFFAVPYTESLCLACVLGTVLAARQGRWGLAGIGGMLAGASRIQGLMVVPVIAFEVLGRRPRPRLGELWPLVFVPCGFLAFVAINQATFGEPFAFVRMQREHYFQHLVPPWSTILDSVRAIAHEPPSSMRVMVHESRLVATGLAALLLLLGLRWLRPADQVYGWGSLCYVCMISWPISLPRYLLTIYPLYFVLARLGRNPHLHQAMAAVSAILFGVLFVLYARGIYTF